MTCTIQYQIYVLILGSYAKYPNLKDVPRFCKIKSFTILITGVTGLIFHILRNVKIFENVVGNVSKHTVKNIQRIYGTDKNFIVNKKGTMKSENNGLLT